MDRPPNPKCELESQVRACESLNLRAQRVKELEAIRGGSSPIPTPELVREKERKDEG